MAVSVLGYPQETNFCPKCGSENISAQDSWNESGEVKCNDCGCKCIVIED